MCILTKSYLDPYTIDRVEIFGQSLIKIQNLLLAPRDLQPTEKRVSHNISIRSAH